MRSLGLKGMVLTICMLSLAAPVQAKIVDFMDLESIEQSSLFESDIRQFLVEGLKALNQGRIGAAEDAFQSALQQNAHSAIAKLGMAQVEMQRNRPEQARKWLAQAELDAPDAAEIQLAWGRYYVVMRKFDQAVTRYDRVLALAPNKLLPLLEVADFYLNKVKNYGKAESLFRQATGIAPKNPTAHYGLAIALAATNQPDEAISAFQKTAKLVPNDPLPIQSMGRLYLTQGQPDRALGAFTQALGKKPDFLPALLDRGDLYLGKGEYQKARQDYQTAISAHPNNTQALLQLGTAFVLEQKPEQAVETFERVLEIDPNSAQAYNNLAWLDISRQTNLDQALARARKAVQLEPKSAAFMDTLGWAHYVRGEFADAESVLDQAVSLIPSDPTIYYHLGVVQQRLGRKQEAAAAFEKALAIDSGFDDAEDAKRRLGEL